MNKKYMKIFTFDVSLFRFLRINNDTHDRTALKKQALKRIIYKNIIDIQLYTTI
jgi:hypothetical protein